MAGKVQLLDILGAALLAAVFISGLAFTPMPAHGAPLQQNQVITTPYGGPGFIVSTSTSGLRFLEASTSPHFGNFTAGNGTINSLTVLSCTGCGITSVGPAGQYQTGPTLTIASSTLSFNGLTVGVQTVGAGNTLTFTPTITGTLDNAGLTNSTVSYGGVTLSLGQSDATPAFNLVDATGLPISTGVAGLGTGVATALGVNVGTAGAFVVNGGALGTPSSGTLTNATGLPIVGGTTGTLTVARGGTGSTTAPSGQALYGGGNGTYQSIATSAPAVSAPITYSGTLGYFLNGVSGSFGCTTASAGTTGCLSGTDYTTFNNKLGAYDAWTHPATGQSATTSLMLFSGAASTTQLSALGPLYVGTTSTTTIWGNATSTFRGGVILATGGLTISTLTGCNTTSALTTDSSGNVICGAVSGSGGSSDPFTHPAANQSATTSLMLFNGQASSTQLSANQAYFGATATTTFFGNGSVGVSTSSPFAFFSINPIAGVGSRQFVVGSSTRTAFVIDNSGNIGIGTTSPLFRMDLSGDTSATAAYYTTRYSADTLPAGFIARKARGTLFAPSAVLSGDSLATFTGRGYGTTVFSGSVGAMDVRAAQDFSDTAMGTDLTFDTTNLGATTRTEKMRLTAGGDLGIGTSTPKWKATLSSSTAPQLTLTDGSLTSAPFNFRAINSALYISTSSPTTFATTSSFIFMTNGATGSTTALKFDVAGSATSTFAGGLFLQAGGLTLGNNTGILKATGGPVTVATNGTDYTLITPISCTNQVVTAITAAGVGTCSSINNAFWSGTDLSVANGGTGLSTFGGTNHILYTTAADTLASEAAFTYNSTADRISYTYGSSTSESSTGSALFGTTGGVLGIGTTTPALPWATLGVNPIAGQASNQFVVGSSTGTAFLINNTGRVGVGSTSPYANLSVNTTAGLDSFAVGSTTTYLRVTSLGTTTATRLDVTGTATSSFSGGINLTSGCFAIANVCVGGGSGAAPGGTGTEIQYRAGAATFGAVGNSAYLTTGNVGFGTTTPWGALSIASTTPTTNPGRPLFSISSTTAAGITSALSGLFNVFATTSTSNLGTGYTGGFDMIDAGSKTIVNGQSWFGGPARATLGVNGPIDNGDWSLSECAGRGGMADAGLSADTPYACGPFYFDENTAATLIPQASAAQSLLFAAQTGQGFLMTTSGTLLNGSLATTTPIFEVVARRSSAMTTAAIISMGFGTSGTADEDGCSFVARPSVANWQAQVYNAGSTVVDTGVPTTSPQFMRFRIEADATGCTFLMQGTSTAMRVVARVNNGATLDTSDASYRYGMSVAQGAGVEFFNLRIWVRKTLWGT